MPTLHLERLPVTPQSEQSVDWLMGKLDWGKTLRSWIPSGFEGYVRVLHPASIDIGRERSTSNVPVPWATVSQWSGKPLHATSHIQDLMLRLDGHDWRQQGEGGQEPNQGEMDRESLSCLLAHLSESGTTSDQIWMLLWFGYGGAADAIGLPIKVSEQLTGSGRQYVLRLGEIVSSEEEHRDSLFEHPPSFYWPTDRSWFVSCDIDASSTYVGGSKKLIEQIMKDPSLETFAAHLDDPHGGLYVSNPAVERENDYVLPRFRLWPFRYRFHIRKGRKSYGSVSLYRKRRWWELGRRR